MRNVNKGRIDPNAVRDMAECVDDAKRLGWVAYGVEFDNDNPCRYTVLAYSQDSKDRKFAKLLYSRYGSARLESQE